MHLCMCQTKPRKLFAECGFKGVPWHDAHLISTGLEHALEYVALKRWHNLREYSKNACDEGPYLAVFLFLRIS